MDSSVVLIIWLICAGLGWAIGNSKGRAGAGFALGLLLGIIGLIIILVLKPVVQQPAGYQQGYQPYPAAQASPAGWWPDPYRRHEMRYFDGQSWTHHVSNRGQQGADPVG